MKSRLNSDVHSSGTELTQGFGLSANEIAEVAHQLVVHLEKSLNRVQTQDIWGKTNFVTLRAFKTHKFKLISYPRPSKDKSKRRAEFLWDYIGYVKGKGIFIAAESEWENTAVRIKEDFEKLLYVRSPIKVMICRVDDTKNAASIRNYLRKYMDNCCTEFSPAEYFILYCRTSGPPRKGKRDVAFGLQIKGAPAHCGLGDGQFQEITGLLA